MNKLIDYLEQLDLSEVEAKLYLTLLQTGPVSVRDLAVTTDMKRTTAYLYVDQLIEKGLAVKMVQSSKKLVAANPPDSIQHLIEKKVASAKEVETAFPSILKSIQTTLPEVKDTNEPEILYSKGKVALKRVYDEALKCKELRVYANLAELENLFKANDFLLEYEVYDNALSNNKDLEIYEIVADTPGSIEKFKLNQTVETNRYHYKYMPADVGLTAPGILMYNNKVAIINGKENFSIVVLTNADYYINSIKLFDFIWKVLPKTQ